MACSDCPTPNPDPDDKNTSKKSDRTFHDDPLPKPQTRQQRRSATSKQSNEPQESSPHTSKPTIDKNHGTTNVKYNPKGLKPRLTIIESIYHQNPNEQPTDYQGRMVIELREEAQPVVRKFKVGPMWKPLDSAWIENPGMIRIINNEGRFFVVHPTYEERQQIATRDIEIGIIPNISEEDLEPRDMHSPPKKSLEIIPAFIVRPGADFRGEAYIFESLYLRCLNGEASCTIEIFPE